MEKSIKNYEPMKQITMKDGRIFIFPSSKYKDFKSKCETNFFLIHVEGVDINKFDIRYIEDLPNDYDVLIGHSEDIRQKALKRFQEYEDRLGKKPDRRAKLHLLNLILEKKE